MIRRTHVPPRLPRRRRAALTLTAAFVAAVALLTTGAAWACTGASVQHHRAWDQAEAVFTARAVEIKAPTPLPDGSFFSPAPRDVLLEVDAVFKGSVKPGTTTTVTWPGVRHRDFQTAVGERYLVYAHHSHGSLRAGLCTRPLRPNAAHDSVLACLRGLRDGTRSFSTGCLSSEEIARRRREVAELEVELPGLPQAIEAAWRACLPGDSRKGSPPPAATIAFRVSPEGHLTVLRYHDGWLGPEGQRHGRGLAPPGPLATCVELRLAKWRPAPPSPMSTSVYQFVRLPLL